MSNNTTNYEDHSTYLSLPTPRGVSARVNLRTGIPNAVFTDVSAANMPSGLSLAHVYDPTCTDTTYGYGFRLNLDEQFKRPILEDGSLGEYTYTDAYGVSYCFPEYFYYVSNGERIYVEKSSVTVNADGSFVCTVNGAEQTVIRELRSANGWEVFTPLENVNNIELFEQRTSEQVELQAQKENWDNALKQYVFVTYYSGIKRCEFPFTLDSLALLADNAYLLLTVDMVDEYQSIPQTSTGARKKEEIRAQMAPHRANFRNLLINSLRAEERLTAIAETVPVCYIRREGVTKGFNADGYLCALATAAGVTLGIERDAEQHITAVYGEKGVVAELFYRNGKLHSLTSENGERVFYTYSANKLSKVAFADHRALQFSYSSDRLSQVRSLQEADTGNSASDRKQTSFTYTNGRLSKVRFYSETLFIYHNVCLAGQKELSSLSFSYSSAASDNESVCTTIVTDEKDNRCKYGFHADGRLSFLYQEEQGRVTQAEQFFYFDTVRQKRIDYCWKQRLHTNPLESFTFSSDKKLLITQNSFYQTIQEFLARIENTVNYDETTDYTYDEGHRLIRETQKRKRWYHDDDTMVDVIEEDVTLSITEYFYGSDDKLIRTERYIPALLSEYGKTVDERIYDDKGRLVETVQYNTLSPSDKLFSSVLLDEHGRTVGEYDATGLYLTESIYGTDRSTPTVALHPNGSRTAVAYDTTGEIAAITQSTAEGESNANTILRTAGEVTRLVSGNTMVDYEYDSKRRVRRIKLNGAEHISYTYTEGENEDTVTTTYADGYAFTETFDKAGRLKQRNEGDATMITCTYTSDGQIWCRSDYAQLRDGCYSYDDKKRLVEFVEGLVTEGFGYDERDRLISRSTNYTGSDASYSYSYSYEDITDRLLSVSCEDIATTFRVDALGRSAGKDVSIWGMPTLSTQIDYLKYGDHATALPQAIRYKRGGAWMEKLRYAYDCMGNISAVYEDDELACRYEYDALNRLVREDNRAMNMSVLIAYDNNGNITSRRTYAFTLKPTAELEAGSYIKKDSYRYDGDRLVSFNDMPCVYDALGNPTTYRGKTLSWCRARQLASFDGILFTYDSYGRRIAPASYGAAYDQSGKPLVWNEFVLIYDGSEVVGFKDMYSFERYAFMKDALGNVIALLDTSGNIVVQYKYDAWGNHLVLDANGNPLDTLPDMYGNLPLGYRNPFRYRGYIYDTQTGLYYLQSRYYDPVTGRFLNADTVEYLEPETVNGLNLYAYCGNNPVMYSDPTGHSAILICMAIVGICALIGALSGAVVSGALYGIENPNGDTRGFWASVAGGAASGAITGIWSGIVLITGGSAGTLIGVGAAFGALSGLAGSLVEGSINGDIKKGGQFWLNDILPSVFWGAAFGALFGGMADPSGSARTIAEATGRTLSQQLNKILTYKVKEKIGPLFAENLLSDFTTWVAKITLKRYYDYFASVFG